MQCFEEFLPPKTPIHARARLSVLVIFDRLHDGGFVALLTSKQNQCQSVSQATFTTWMSEEFELLLSKKKKN